jgi:hypothetical protein
MATEQEELRLTVNLADNASAGLAKLNEEIKQLGSGASQQHVEKFRRETQDVTRHVKQMGGEVGEAFKGLGMLRGGLAAGAAGLALFGFEIARQSKALIEYADKIRTLNQQARQIGVNPAQFKDVQEQLKAFGIDGQTAASSIAAISGKIADLQRQGSQLRLELLKNAGPDRESVQNMQAYIDRLTRAKTVAEQLNIMREGGEQVYRNAIRSGASEQEAANRRNQFWQMQGYNALLANAGKLKELSAAEQERANKRQAEAEALANQWGQLSGKYDTLIEKLKAPFVPYLITALKMAEGVLDSIISKVEEVQEKKLLQPDKAKESIQERFGRFGIGGGGGSSFQERWKERVPQELEKNTEATKQLTELLRMGGYQPTSFGGGGFGGGGIIPASLGGPGLGGGRGGRPAGAAGFGGGGYTNLGAGGGIPSAIGGAAGGAGQIPQSLRGGAAPYGSDVGAGAGAGAGATPAGPPTGGGAAVPGGGGGAAGALQSKLEGMIKGSSLEGYMPADAARYGMKTGSAQEWARLMTGIAGKESSFNPATVGDVGRFGSGSRGLFQLSEQDAITYGLQDKPFTKEQLADPDFNAQMALKIAERRARAGGIGGAQGIAKYWAGSRGYLARGQVSAAGAPYGSDVGAGTGAGAGETSAGGGAGGVPRTYERRRGESGEFNYAATGAFGRPGENLTTITLKNGQKAQVNANVAERFRGFANEMIDKGYPVDLRGGGGYAMRSKRGGGGYSMHAYGSALDINVAKNPMGGRTTDMPPDVEETAWRHGLSWGGRFGDPMHFEAMGPEAAANKRKILEARGVIDKKQAAETKVNGTGKITVDVNAPKGTNVGAEGGGLFKKVEINRQTQMSEAPRGPKGGYATEALLQ